MIVLPEVNYLTEPKGLKSWLVTLDHKRIGLLYFFGTTFFFMLGGIFAVLLRLELLGPGVDFVGKDTYNQFFTLHGAIMIFLFIIPGIPAALGNIIMPLMLGAKDVAFPRLNLASWYIYVLGALFFVFSILAGAADTGWTFYTPYSSQTNTAVISTAFGVFILCFSSIFTGLNFIVTIHKLRAPGLTWFKLPLFVWGLYATAIIQVLATPVIGITMVLLFLERVASIGIFDPALGGDPVLFQHFFWFYSHPAVYIMILPGMGIISEIISVHSHRKIFGYKPIAFSSLGIALISFFVWGHHMFTSGQSVFAAMVFSFLTFLVGIPSGIKVFNWIATMFGGSIRFTTPMLYAISFLILFSIGGFTGIALGVISVDIHLHDTYFVVAHFHYVMMGGTVIALLAGLHHWWPKIWGRMYSEFWGKLTAVIIFIGFNMTFFTQFIMGAQGMPRRYATYDPQYSLYHEFSSYGSWILGLGFVIMAIYLVHSIFRGQPAGDNPWGALTLEWRTTSPPDPHNFAEIPKVRNRPYSFDKFIAKSRFQDQLENGANGKHKESETEKV